MATFTTAQYKKLLSAARTCCQQLQQPSSFVKPTCCNTFTCRQLDAAAHGQRHASIICQMQQLWIPHQHLPDSLYPCCSIPMASLQELRCARAHALICACRHSAQQQAAWPAVALPLQLQHC
jgi:hypothetical protein